MTAAGEKSAAMRLFEGALAAAKVEAAREGLAGDLFALAARARAPRILFEAHDPQAAVGLLREAIAAIESDPVGPTEGSA